MKNYSEKHILDLIGKSDRNEATEQELQELDQWYNSFDQDPLYTEGMSRNDEEEAMQMLLHRIHREIGVETVPVRQQRLWFTQGWTVAVAALIVLISGIGLFFYLNNKGPLNLNGTALGSGPTIGNANSATLTLASGKKIKLSERNMGELANEAGVVITKTDDGKLVYEIQNSSAETKSINTISTAIGETYQVRFSDGTAVWLNAASSLRFPARFTGQPLREIELNGEAYFEVAKDKLHPFVVKTRGQEVKVLGTHFNINSYSDEPKVETTLLEGLVQVSLVDSKKRNVAFKNVLLKPGQQSALMDNDIKVANVQTDDIIAWKNGYFMFNNESMESVMRKLSRWYNIEVKYTDPAVRKITFFGTVSRFAEVSKVLEMLELTKEVKFEVKGNEITVLKN